MKIQQSASRTTRVAQRLLLSLLAGSFVVLHAVAVPATPEQSAVLRPQAAAGPLRASFESAPGAWQVHWDAWRGAARRGLASHGALGDRIGADQVARRADAFVNRHAAALGASGTELWRVRMRRSGNAWLVTWVQHVDGVRLVGAFLDLTLRTDGAVVAFRSSLRPGVRVVPARVPRSRAHDISSTTLPGTRLERSTACLLVDPTRPTEGIPAEEVVLRNETGGRWLLRVSRVDGKILQQVDLVRTQGLAGTCRGKVRPQYVQDPAEDRQLPWLRVQVGADPQAAVTYGDSDGHWSLEATPGTHDVRAELRGRYVQVQNQAGVPQALVELQADSPGNADLEFSVLNSRMDERTIYYHVNRVHDLFHERFGFTLLDFPVQAIAVAADPGTGDPNYPNAFWNGEVLGFGNGGGTFFNTGEFSDVIFHEYVHATTDFIYRPIGELHLYIVGGSMHEAFSDYFAASFHDDPVIGEGMYRNRTPWIRNLESHRVWPDDMDLSVRADVHRNGLILSGALWDLRQAVGATVADAVAHHARELLPLDYHEYFEAALLQDDLLFGDAIPGNGSPHHDAILLAFGAHGIGPLREGDLALEHEPLYDTEDDTRPRLVRARMHSMYSGTDRAMRLLWSTGGAFEGIWMQETDRGTFEAQIPAQPVGSQVRYYVTAMQLPPIVTATAPASAPTQTYSYTVGPDTSPPTITHVPPEQHAAFTGAPRLTATATDNSGIAAAWLEYRIDGGTRSTAGLVADPASRNDFTGRLPIALPTGTTLEYRVHAVDRSSAQHRTVKPSQGWYALHVVDDLQLDFESGPAGWTHEALLLDRSDGWTRSMAHNHSLPGSWAWHCQTVAARDTRVAAVLVTPIFELEQAASASLWSWIRATTDGADAVDGAQIQIRVEDAPWEVLTPLEGYTHRLAADIDTNYLSPGSPCLSGTGQDWQQLHFDLSPYAGRSVRLRFLFASASPVRIDTSEWFLDDFTLQPGSPIASDAVVPGAPSGRLLVQPPSPNPFNPSVEFLLDSPDERSQVRLDILDVQGRRVRTLLHGPLAPGRTRVRWDGRDRRGLASASGVYYYLLDSGLGRETGTIVLVR